MEMNQRLYLWMSEKTFTYTELSINNALSSSRVRDQNNLNILMYKTVSCVWK